MSKYLTLQAIQWSINRLADLPKNQTALLYFLIFPHSPKVDRTNPSSNASFIKEFYRYFGGFIKGGGIACYDPFAREWRAEEYLNSTVYGRLLVGSHKWTEGDEAFFLRDPRSGGWPAQFLLTDGGFNNLKYRSSPPCLKFDYRLPIKVMAVYYYRFDDLSDLDLSGLEDLTEQYRKTVISKHPRLGELFKEGPSYLGSLFTDEPLAEANKISCYPPAPFCNETMTKQLLYTGDVEYIRTKLKAGQTIADYIRKLLIGGEV